jgi:hypothetical protein
MRPHHCPPVRSPFRRVRLAVEVLESRVVPYATSGNAWPNPQLITLSFVPDGTVVGSNGSSYFYSNLFASFNAKFGSAAKWQNEVLRAAQVWAQQTNINFALVSDNGDHIGAGSYQQGDPVKGDIRISGYNFGSSTLAQAEVPPSANNYSIAGDIQINTSQAFNIGSTYDLFSVVSHEIGHALGLEHSGNSQATLYPYYNGTKSSLSSDDVAGARSIYSSGAVRSPDRFDATASNGTFATATGITSSINTKSLTALLTGLDISTTADMDYYQFTAPSGTSSPWTVSVQSSGLSLLAPTLTVYDSNQNQIGLVSGAKQYGTTLTLTLSNKLVAGQIYYIKVGGADTSAFGTGAYALTLNLGSGSSPVVPLPNTQTANGQPLSGGGGLADSTLLPDPWLVSLLLDLVARDALEPSPASGSSSASMPASPGVTVPQPRPLQAPPTGVVLANLKTAVTSAGEVRLPLISACVSAPRTLPSLSAVAMAAAQPVTSNVPPMVREVPAVNHDTASGGGDAVMAPAADIPPTVPLPPPDEVSGTAGEAPKGTTGPERQASDRCFSERLWGPASEETVPALEVLDGKEAAGTATLAIPVALLFWSAQPEPRDDRRGRRIVKC